jgi:hypothetical protein
MAKFYPSPVRLVWLLWLAALLSGITVGAILNFAEAFGVSGASDFGNYFGLWIFIITMVAAWSPTWQRAVLHSVTFLIAMVTTYYLSTLLLSGYFLVHLLRAWVAVTIVFASPFAAFAWYGRKTGWYAALAAAMPIGLLLYEAYSLSHVPQLHGVQLVFDILAALVLLLVLPRDQNQRLRVFAFIPLFAFGAKVINEYVLPFAAGFRL